MISVKISIQSQLHNYVILRITDFMDFVHRYSKITQRFGNWTCCSPQVRGWGGSYSVWSTCTVAMAVKAICKYYGTVSKCDLNPHSQYLFQLHK
jgi:hypothetical protein